MPRRHELGMLAKRYSYNPHTRDRKISPAVANTRQATSGARRPGPERVHNPAHISQAAALTTIWPYLSQ